MKKKRKKLDRATIRSNEYRSVLDAMIGLNAEMQAAIQSNDSAKLKAALAAFDELWKPFAGLSAILAENLSEIMVEHGDMKRALTAIRMRDEFREDAAGRGIYRD